MANGTGAASSAAAAATGAAAGKKSFSAWYAGHKPEAAIGAAGIVVAIALYVKSKNAAASSGNATPSTSTVMPGTLAPDTGNFGGGDLAGLDSVLSQLSNQLGALQPTGSSSSAGSAPGSQPAPPTTLPTLNPADFPEIVPYGQYAPTDYTKIGTVTAGQFHGTNVGGDVPVYANVFGGMAQGFNEATLPSGTDLYIPSQFTGYETSKS